MAVFNYLRLSLSTPPVGELLVGERDNPDVDRQEFLLNMFSARRDFFYSGKQYSYVPLTVDRLSYRVVGLVGRPHEQTVNGPPESLFAPQQSKYHRAAVVVGDLSKEKQIVAMQYRHDVGSPERIITAIAEQFIRERKGFSWHVDVAYISYEREFWGAVNDYRGTITELRFEFFPPNGVFGFDRWKEFNKKLLEQNNGGKSEYAIKNDDGGLDPKGEFVKEAIEYTSQGPGRAIMKSGRRVIYSSSSERQKAEVPDDLLPTASDRIAPLGLWDYVFSRLIR